MTNRAAEAALADGLPALRIARRAFLQSSKQRKAFDLRGTTSMLEHLCIVTAMNMCICDSAHWLSLFAHTFESCDVFQHEVSRAPRSNAAMTQTALSLRSRRYMNRQRRSTGIETAVHNGELWHRWSLTVMPGKQDKLMYYVQNHASVRGSWINADHNR